MNMHLTKCMGYYSLFPQISLSYVVDMLGLKNGYVLYHATREGSTHVCQIIS
jgi:hypothetical protein